MSESRSYRIVLWSLVLFVLVVATPGWYIQIRLAQKVYPLDESMAAMEERVAALEERVEELASQPADDRTGDEATDAGDDGQGEPAERSSN